jgi:hypothetical protein
MMQQTRSSIVLLTISATINPSTTNNNNYFLYTMNKLVFITLALFFSTASSYSCSSLPTRRQLAEKIGIAAATAVGTAVLPELANAAEGVCSLRTQICNAGIVLPAASFGYTQTTVGQINAQSLLPQKPNNNLFPRTNKNNVAERNYLVYTTTPNRMAFLSDAVQSFGM